MLNSTPNRLFLFPNGSVLSTFTTTTNQRNNVWSNSIITEPSGKCFTSLSPNHQEEIQNNSSAARVKAALLANTATPTPFTNRLTHPCQTNHHLTRYCSHQILPRLRQTITFRNMYHPTPTLIKHTPTNKYIGNSKISTMNTLITSRVQPIEMIHWPKTFSHQYCSVYGNDGAIRIVSLDGRASFILAPHRQLFQLHFPTAIFETKTTTTNEIKKGEIESNNGEDESEGRNQNEIEREGIERDGIERDKIDHGGIVQLIWVRQCPFNLLKILSLARETASKIILLNGTYVLNETRSENDDGDDNDEAEEMLSIMLPKAMNDRENEKDDTESKYGKEKGRLSWNTAAVGLGGSNEISAESIVLCTSEHSLPIQKRVAVEWTSKATYWLHDITPTEEQQIEQIKQQQIEQQTDHPKHHIIGCLIHESNTFMTCQVDSTAHKTNAIHFQDNDMETNESTKLQTPRIPSGWIKIYRSNVLGECITLSTTTHIPSLAESRAVKHMLACIQHCHRTPAPSNQNQSMLNPSKSSKSKIKSKNTFKSTLITTTNEQQDGDRNTIIEVADVKNVGKFIYYNDRRLRCVFADRTIVRIDSKWSCVEIIRSDGIFVQCLVEKPSPFEEKYIRSLIEFGNWCGMNPMERNQCVLKERNYQARVVTEADRIRRFLELDALEQENAVMYEDDGDGTEGNGVVNDREREDPSLVNTFLVPNVVNVLKGPVSVTNPTDWIPAPLLKSGGGVSENVVPGREVMERYIHNTLYETKKFLDKER